MSGLFNQELIDKCVTDQVTVEFLLNGGVWLVAENPPLCIYFDKKADKICTYVDYELERDNKLSQRITELESALANRDEHIARVEKENAVLNKAIELCWRTLSTELFMNGVLTKHETDNAYWIAKAREELANATV
jgi:predicted nuclease with TOPRIM domain